MSAEVIYKNGVTIAGGGSDVLNGLIGDLFDQDNISANLDEDVMSKKGLTYTKPLNLEETFDIMVGSQDLEEIYEGDNLPEIDLTKGKGKGFELKIFGGKYKVSKQFMKWAESSETLEGADSSVKTEWARIARNIKGLERSKIKTKNKLFTELFAEGRKSNNAFGPGSLGAYGQPLFSTAHPYLEGKETFSNYAGDLTLDATDDAAIATSRANIKTVLNLVKNEARLQNGDYIEIPDVYELHVPRALGTTAREVLNNGSRFAPDGSNSSKENVFNFEGSKIKIVEDSTLGSFDKDGNVIGTQTMWFIYNKEGAMNASAARYIELYPAEIEVYKNDDNKNHYISVDMSCTVDHYGLECFVAGANIPDENGNVA